MISVISPRADFLISSPLMYQGYRRQEPDDGEHAVRYREAGPSRCRGGWPEQPSPPVP
jgi:hypothetical protein